MGVLALAYSPDGRVLAVDGRDGKLMLYDPEIGKQTHSFTLKASSFPQTGCVTWSPDGKSLGVSRECDFFIVDSTTGKVLFQNESHCEIQELAFSPDGKKLVVGTINPAGQIWDLATKKCVHKLEGQTTGCCVAFSPDGKRVATGSGEIILWNAETGKEEFRLGGEADDLFLRLAFTPDGRTLVAGSQEGTVSEWDLGTQAQMQKLDGKMDILRSIALSADGKKIAASFAYNAIRLWDRKSGKMLFSNRPDHLASIEALAFSPDGRKLVTGSDLQTIHIWETPSGRHSRALQTKTSADKAVYSFDQKYLATSWRWNPNIQIWDAATGNHLRELDTKESGIKGIAFIANGKEIVALSSPVKQTSATLTRWQVENGELLQRDNMRVTIPERGLFFRLTKNGWWLETATSWKFGAFTRVKSWVN